MLVTSSIQPNSYHNRKRQLEYHSKEKSQGQFYIQNNSIIKKPLEVRQQTFKGFYNFGEKLFKTTVEKVPSNLSKFTFKTLEELSSKQHEIYSDITDKFIERVKSDASFRKKLKLSDTWSEKISRDNLPYLPEKAKALTFLQAIFSPVTAVLNIYKPLLSGEFGEKIAPSIHKSLLKENEQQILIDRYKGFLGLNNSIKSFENSYRRYSGNHYILDETDDFIIPKDILHRNIQSKRPSTVDPGKGKYSTKSLMLGNRLISGLVYAVYLSTDAYNTTMKFSGEKDESKRQQASRFAQENARIGLNLYLQSLIFTMFERSMNKNLGSALLASGATVALSEIIGRQLVSKPIMPSDKKTLDSMEQEMISKKGFLPSLGRLMTRVKKTDNSNTSKNQEMKMPIESAFANPFASFKSSHLPDNVNHLSPSLNNKISFTGFEKTAQVFDADNLNKLLNVIEKFDSSQLKYYKEIIEHGLKIDNKKVSLEQFVEKNSLVPIGDKMTLQGKLMHSFFAPVYWIKGIFKSAEKAIKSLSPLKKHQEMLNFIKKNSLENEFQEHLENRLKLPVWQNSSLQLSQKHSKILQEFVEGKSRIQKEIQGVKNVLLWLDKQVKSNKFDLSKLTAEQRKVLDSSLEKSMIIADSSKHLEYDGNTLTQLNINLARAITTIFLVTDAYNLTMQYSNDNKKEAQGSAKSRAVQEITRISVSAYMLGFIHNLMARVCNSSLFGAFAVTATTSIVNDSLARIIVGVPLTTKTQEQLKKRDEKIK